MAGFILIQEPEITDHTVQQSKGATAMKRPDWEPGHDPRTRKMAAAMLMLMLAAFSFLAVCAALASGCCTFCNTGSLSGADTRFDHFADPGKMVPIDEWEYHIAAPGKMIQDQIAAAESVYWKGII